MIHYKDAFLIVLAFILGMLIIYLGTLKTPKWFIKICGEMYVAYLIVKRNLRPFLEYIVVVWQYYSFCIKSGLNRLKMRKMKKRAEKAVKSGEIYSKKQV
jgi:cellulose synthase/poly-beta-1,6-N-acetylglucosamine synthase-like glycosyltransferase